jgi:C-terminal processing protease CtpA/Prc
VEALDKAAADPEVKNFVLDLTCNNGGEANVLATITNLLAGKSTFPFENVLTKQRGIVTMLIDANFDRVFDDKDKAPRHPELNIAIMTSRYAFSCGNLLPSLMKDYGFLIIGQKSGGGSCSIQQMCTAEGFCYILSSARLRLNNKAGENIDGGVEPHIALEVKQATGKDDDGEDVKYLDFSAFYAPSVGDQIVNWYANK